jgi:predicted alpha/beta-hydrolase family hydrolase
MHPAPVIVFAPGAGAPSSSPWMRAWAKRLEGLGYVAPFDYSYQRAGRRSPDPMPKLLAAHRAAVESARATHTGPVILAGKSMGSRVGCHLSLEEPVLGLVCFGYPLKGMGKAGKLRDEVLRALTTPVLFIQGTRDSLCPLDTLAEVREQMTARNELFVVEGGDHSLSVTKTQLARDGRTQDDVDAEIFARVRDFVESLPKS